MSGHPGIEGRDLVSDHASDLDVRRRRSMSFARAIHSSSGQEASAYVQVATGFALGEKSRGDAHI